MKSTLAKIVDIDVKKNGSAFVKLEKNGLLIGKKNNDDSFNSKLDEVESVSASDLSIKILKSNQDATSSVKASLKYSALIGDENIRVVSAANYGNFIIGPTTFSSHPENIRIGNVFRLNGLLTSTMASTIVTPIPVLVFDNPIQDSIKNAVSLTKEYSEFIQGLL